MRNKRKGFNYPFFIPLNHGRKNTKGHDNKAVLIDAEN
jgi:hypothetical protein